MNNRRVLLAIGFGLGVAVLAVATPGTLLLSDWKHPHDSDFDQVGVLIVAVIALAGAADALLARHMRRSR